MYDEMSTTKGHPGVPQESQDYVLRSPNVEHNYIFILRTKCLQKSPNDPIGMHLHDCLQKKRLCYLKAQTALPCSIFT